MAQRLIDADAAIDAVNDVIADYIPNLYGRYEELPLEMASAINRLPSAQPTIERDVPKRVLWTGWKGHRDTRYKCPTCNKPVRNDDDYCHRCGQRLMFPKISFTPYVEGQKQELIVRWDDETD